MKTNNEQKRAAKAPQKKELISTTFTKSELVTFWCTIISIIFIAVCVMFACALPAKAEEPVVEVQQVFSLATGPKEDKSVTYEIIFVPAEPEPVEEEAVVEEATYDPNELEMMAIVIYQEAGGDACSDTTRKMVGDVVLNRMMDPRFPDTMYGVLTAPNQYLMENGVYWPERASYPGEQHAVQRAYRIAEELLTGSHSEIYGKGYVWQAEFYQGTDWVYSDNEIFGR